MEVSATGEILVFANSPYEDLVDSLLYSSVVTVERLAPNGVLLEESHLFIPYKATYVGWANVGGGIENEGFFAAGTTIDTSGFNHCALFQFDQQGHPSLLLEYGPPGQGWIGRQAKQTLDGGYVIVGETSSVGVGDGFLLKSDSAGAVQWVQTYGTPTQIDLLASVDLGPENSLYLGGSKDTVVTNNDSWVIRVDSVGQVLWETGLSTPLDDNSLAHVMSSQDGGVVAATGLSSGTGTRKWPCLAKWDSTGSLVWSKTYGLDEFSTLFFVSKELPNGDILAAGLSYVPGYQQGQLLRTTSNGDSLWMRYYVYADSLLTDGKGTFRDVEPTPDGGFVAVGTVYNSASGNNPPGYNQDVWVVKVDSMGCLVPGCHLITGLQSQVTNLRDALTVAPNPASEVARLSWELPQTLVGSAQLTVVSAAGQLVGTVPLVLAVQSHALDVSSYPAGLYHLHLVVDGQWVSGCKMVVE